ncbi:hypothetical protein TIFTF001_007054 [Ficus carica]|uniref:Uncharacterized protein n=1 Tax=Ficus carica TaxID=3494 RepID=A0AA87ZSH8_FICCA|nr:hypothetical protein TIFTF001_007054 [Ficus carica]
MGSRVRHPIFAGHERHSPLPQYERLPISLLSLSRFRRKPSSTDGERAQASIFAIVSAVAEANSRVLQCVQAYLVDVVERDHGKLERVAKGLSFQGGEGEGLSSEAAWMLGGEEGEALCHSPRVVSLLLLSCVALIHGLSCRTPTVSSFLAPPTEPSKSRLTLVKGRVEMKRAAVEDLRVPSIATATASA